MLGTRSHRAYTTMKSRCLSNQSGAAETTDALTYLSSACFGFSSLNDIFPHTQIPRLSQGMVMACPPSFLRRSSSQDTVHSKPWRLETRSSDWFIMTTVCIAVFAVSDAETWTSIPISLQGAGRLSVWHGKGKRASMKSPMKLIFD